MASYLSPAKLRSADQADAIKHLLSLSKSEEIEAITKRLLSLIESGSIPPNFLGAWLSSTKSIAAISHSLKQTHSLRGRSTAIRELVKWLCSHQDADRAGDFADGIAGLADLTHNLSVAEVSHVVRLLTKHARHKPHLERDMDTLHKLLTHPENPSSMRPLNDIYNRLLPVCSEGYIRSHLKPQGLIDKSMRRTLATQHPGLYKEYVEDMLFGEDDQGNDSSAEFEATLLTTLQGGSNEPDLSNSMSFSLSLLRRFASDDGESANISADDYVQEILDPLIRRLVKKKRNVLTRLDEIADLALKYAEMQSNDNILNPKRHGYFVSRGPNTFCKALISCWIQEPQIFEKHLERLLRLDSLHISLGANLKERSLKVFDKYEEWFVDEVPRDHCYALLEMIIRSYGFMKVGLTSIESLKSLQFQWPLFLFMNMNRKQASTLLESLRKAYDDNVIHPRAVKTPER